MPNEVPAVQCPKEQHANTLGIRACSLVAQKQISSIFVCSRSLRCDVIAKEQLRTDMGTPARRHVRQR